MKKWLLAIGLMLACLFPSLGTAQSVSFWTDRAVGTFPIPSGHGVTALIPIQYGQVRVCNFPAVGSPCSNVASVTDINGQPLSIVGGNFGQVATDIVGRFSFGATPGTYQIQVAAASSNVPQLSYPVTIPFNNGLGNLVTGNNTWTGTNTFNLPIVAPALTVSTHGDRQVILQNPDFEGSSVIPPPGWSLRVGSPTLSYETVTQAPGKTQSLKIVKGADGLSDNIVQNNIFSCLSGESYSITAMVKTDGVASAELDLRDNNGGFFATTTTTSASWTKLTAAGTINTTNPQSCQVIIGFTNTTAGTVWFDQISVRKLDFPGPLQAVTYSATTHIDRQIILQNPDFEGSSLIPPPGWPIRNGNPSLSYETSTQAPGKNQSLRLTSGATGGCVFSSNTFSVFPGETYAFVGMAKADGAGGIAQLDLSLQDKTGAGIADIFINYSGTTWSQQTASGVVPANAVQARMLLCNNAAGSTVWFDQISIQKLTFPGSLVAAGPSPWIDPTSPIYGAKCDGSTDDTSAFNTAISSVNANGGGSILVPSTKTCVIAGQLNLNQVTDVSIIGMADNSGFRPKLLFTGTTSPLVDARSSRSVRFEGLNLVANNASLSGTARFLDFEHSIAQDSFQVLIRNTAISGVNNSTILCLLCLDNADQIEVDRTSFQNSINGIRLNSTVNFNVHDSYFNTPGAGTIGGAMITCAGNAIDAQSKIGPGNFFEMGGSGAVPTVLDGTGGCGPISFDGNNTGDTPAGYSGTEFKNMGPQVFSLTNNLITGGTSLLGTMMTVANGTIGLVSTGNTIEEFSVGYAWGTTDNNVAVLGNAYIGVTTLQTGNPSSGFLANASGAITSFGNLSVASGSNFSVGGGATISNTNAVPQIGTPPAGQAACIKSVGPPIVIGQCTTAVGAGGACTCS